MAPFVRRLFHSALVRSHFRSQVSSGSAAVLGQSRQFRDLPPLLTLSLVSALDRGQGSVSRDQFAQIITIARRLSVEAIAALILGLAESKRISQLGPVLAGPCAEVFSRQLPIIAMALRRIRALPALGSDARVDECAMYLQSHRVVAAVCILIIQGASIDPTPLVDIQSQWTRLLNEVRSVGYSCAHPRGIEVGYGAVAALSFTLQTSGVVRTAALPLEYLRQCVPAITADVGKGGSVQSAYSTAGLLRCIAADNASQLFCVRSPLGTTAPYLVPPRRPSANLAHVGSLLFELRHAVGDAAGRLEGGECDTSALIGSTARSLAAAVVGCALSSIVSSSCEAALSQCRAIVSTSAATSVPFVRCFGDVEAMAAFVFGVGVAAAVLRALGRDDLTASAVVTVRRVARSFLRHASLLCVGSLSFPPFAGLAEAGSRGEGCTPQRPIGVLPHIAAPLPPSRVVSSVQVLAAGCALIGVPEVAACVATVALCLEERLPDAVRGGGQVVGRWEVLAAGMACAVGVSAAGTNGERSVRPLLGLALPCVLQEWWWGDALHTCVGGLTSYSRGFAAPAGGDWWEAHNKAEALARQEFFGDAVETSPAEGWFLGVITQHDGTPLGSISLYSNDSAAVRQSDAGKGYEGDLSCGGDDRGVSASFALSETPQRHTVASTLSRICATAVALEAPAVGFVADVLRCVYVSRGAVRDVAAALLDPPLPRPDLRAVLGTHAASAQSCAVAVSTAPLSCVDAPPPSPEGRPPPPPPPPGEAEERVRSLSRPFLPIRGDILQLMSDPKCSSVWRRSFALVQSVLDTKAEDRTAVDSHAKCSESYAFPSDLDVHPYGFQRSGGGAVPLRTLRALATHYTAKSTTWGGSGVLLHGPEGSSQEGIRNALLATVLRANAANAFLETGASLALASEDAVDLVAPPVGAVLSAIRHSRCVTSALPGSWVVVSFTGSGETSAEHFCDAAAADVGGRTPVAHAEYAGMEWTKSDAYPVIPGGRLSRACASASGLPTPRDSFSDSLATEPLQEPQSMLSGSVNDSTTPTQTVWRPGFPTTHSPSSLVDELAVSTLSRQPPRLVSRDLAAQRAVRHLHGRRVGRLSQALNCHNLGPFTIAVGPVSCYAPTNSVFSSLEAGVEALAVSLKNSGSSLVEMKEGSLEALPAPKREVVSDARSFWLSAFAPCKGQTDPEAVADGVIDYVALRCISECCSRFGPHVAHVVRGTSVHIPLPPAVTISLSHALRTIHRMEMSARQTGSVSKRSLEACRMSELAPSNAPQLPYCGLPLRSSPSNTHTSASVVPPHLVTITTPLRPAVELSTFARNSPLPPMPRRTHSRVVGAVRGTDYASTYTASLAVLQSRLRADDNDEAWSVWMSKVASKSVEEHVSSEGERVRVCVYLHDGAKLRAPPPSGSLNSPDPGSAVVVEVTWGVPVEAVILGVLHAAGPSPPASDTSSGSSGARPSHVPVLVYIHSGETWCCVRLRRSMLELPLSAVIAAAERQVGVSSSLTPRDAPSKASALPPPASQRAGVRVVLVCLL